MNRYFFLFAFVCLVGCTDSFDPVIESDILGSWQLEATKISPGNVVENWTMVENGEILVLNQDGSFEIQGRDGTSSGTYTYEVELLTLTSDANTSNFFVGFENDKMVLGFIGCIEECSYRYKRID